MLDLSSITVAGRDVFVPQHSFTLSPDATISRPDAPLSSSVQRALEALPQLDLGASPDAEFSLSCRLAQGGMGAIYAARQRSLEREVALKAVRPDAVNRASAIAALLTEARVQGALEHPNVVPIHAFGLNSDGEPVLVMKRLSAVSWRTLIRDPNHPAWPPEAGDRMTWHLQTLMQVSNAVHFAHSRGVIHRDLKPDNVMVGEFGEIYVLDWGLACNPQAEDAVSPAVVGTPAYMAPEMLAGTGPHLGPWTDVYLLGAVLHEILMGEPRHDGDTLLAVLSKVATSAPFDYPPSVPAELGALCNCATSRDPDARPATALAFRRQIAEHLFHRGSIALSEAASSRAAELRRAASSPAPDGDPVGRDLQIRACFSEASFGYLQALRAWEANTAARQGLDALRIWMIEYELSHRNAKAAAALLAELPEAPPELAARVDALSAELAREREELAALRDAVHDMNPVESFRLRSLVLVIQGAAIATILLGLWTIRPAGPTHLEVIIATCLGELVVGIAAYWHRHAAFATLFNRRFWSGDMQILAGIAWNHLTCSVLGVGVDRALVANMIIGAIGISSHASATIPGAHAAAVVFGVGSLSAAAWPRWSLPITAVATALALALAALVSFLVLREQEKRAAQAGLKRSSPPP